MEAETRRQNTCKDCCCRSYICPWKNDFLYLGFNSTVGVGNICVLICVCVCFFFFFNYLSVRNKTHTNVCLMPLGCTCYPQGGFLVVAEKRFALHNYNLSMIPLVFSCAAAAMCSMCVLFCPVWSRTAARTLCTPVTSWSIQSLACSPAMTFTARPQNRIASRSRLL